MKSIIPTLKKIFIWYLIFALVSLSGIPVVHAEDSATTTPTPSDASSSVTPASTPAETVTPSNSPTSSAPDPTVDRDGYKSYMRDQAMEQMGVTSTPTPTAQTPAPNQGVTNSTVTGQTNSSLNNGATTAKTGDANTSGTAVTGVNTNLSGVSVSEFNVTGQQKGDIVLSPEALAANCIENCNNGGNSTNTTQTNNAQVGNNLTLSANSGDNKSNFNTGGDTTITTGNANVSANALTFANNNIAGNVTYGVVNIYGNLEGDIVLPAQSTSFDVVSSSSATTTQNNDVKITNTLTLDTNTGNNNAGFNTDGNTTVTTGQSSVDTNVLNIANSNVNGTWWLVLVNEAGNWIGKLVGAPDGAHMAGSAGTEFTVSPDGQVSASLANNGTGSENTIQTQTESATTTTQSNSADIANTLHLSANTGGNDARFNTNGQNNIATGNANIIANLVNFVNNNIVGNGKLVVTVVNVFGSWLGDFVTPGQTKNATAQSTNGQSTQNIQENSILNNQPLQEQALPTASFVPSATTAQNMNGTITTDFPNSSIGAVPQQVLGTTQVAGISSDNSQPQGNTQQNFVWLLLLAPFMFVSLILRRVMTSF